MEIVIYQDKDNQPVEVDTLETYQGTPHFLADRAPQNKGITRLMIVKFHGRDRIQLSTYSINRTQMVGKITYLDTQWVTL